MLVKKFSDKAIREYNDKVNAIISDFSNQIFIEIMQVHLASFANFSDKDYDKSIKFLNTKKETLKQIYLIPDKEEE